MRMRHAPSPRHLLPLAGFMLLMAGCASVQSPDGWAPATPEDGTLYASLHGGKISSLDAETYEERWEFPAENEFACGNDAARDHDLEGIYGAPAISDSMIYVGAYDGSAYAVNKEDGNCAWQFETDDFIVGGVVLGEAGLYVPSSDGFLYLVDPETGAETASFEAGDLWATPLLTEDAVYQPTMEGKLWKLDPETLEPIWEEPFETDSALLTAPGGGIVRPVPLQRGMPLEGVEQVVVGGIGRTLFSIDPTRGEEQWGYDGGNWFWGQPIFSGDAVFATNLDGKVYAVNRDTGEELWTFATGEKIRAAAAILGDAVIVVNNSGDAYSLDAATGDRNWGPIDLKETVYADPVVIDDLVFVVARNGAVITINEDGDIDEVVDG